MGLSILIFICATANFGQADQNALASADTHQLPPLLFSNIAAVVEEMEVLKKLDEVSALQFWQHNSVIIIVATLFIISLIVAGVMYKQSQVQQNINRLLIAKNEQIQMQSEELLVQSEEVKKLNEDLEALNQNLENKIRSRTRMLKDQNNLLAEYAYSNAHELRAPVASVMGLVDLLNRSQLSCEEKEIVAHLRKSASRLDVVIRDIRNKLERNDVLFLDDTDKYEW